MKNLSSLCLFSALLLGVGASPRAQTVGRTADSANAPAFAQATLAGVDQPRFDMKTQTSTSTAARADSLPQAPSHSLLSRLRGGAPSSTAPGGRIVNGQTYVQPNRHALLKDYLHDTYGLPGVSRTTVTALYAEGRGKPNGWGTDAAGFGQRFGSAAAVTAINGTVRFGFENAFHEDLRYIPCHGCRTKQKIANALLSEITARHGADGHRGFSLTPTIADMAGPIITHTLWYPGGSGGPEQGAVTARTVFATRIGAHLFEEFVWERRHKDVHSEMGSRTQ